jgi:hypothetical protein
VQLLGRTSRKSLQIALGKAVFPLRSPVPALEPSEPLPKTRVEPFGPLKFRRTHDPHLASTDRATPNGSS